MRWRITEVFRHHFKSAIREHFVVVHQACDRVLLVAGEDSGFASPSLAGDDFGSDVNWALLVGIHRAVDESLVVARFEGAFDISCFFIRDASGLLEIFTKIFLEKLPCKALFSTSKGMTTSVHQQTAGQRRNLGP